MNWAFCIENEPHWWCQGERACLGRGRSLLRVSVGSNQITIKCAFIASPLITQHAGERAKSGWFEIMIMCPNVST